MTFLDRSILVSKPKLRMLNQLYKQAVNKLDINILDLIGKLNC